MSTGGFIAAEYSFSVIPNTLSSYNAEAEQVKKLLKGITEAIISTNQGWQYDIQYTATSDDYVKIGNNSSSWEHASFAQFLINTVSGSKLLVAYLTGSTAPVDNSLKATYFADSTVMYICNGLAMSIIPGGSNQTWDISDNCTTANFIPLRGTYLFGNTREGSSSSYPRFLTPNSMNTEYFYRYVLVVKGDVIICSWQQTNNGNINGTMAIGKIFGELCNSNDNNVCSHYGAIKFSPIGGYESNINSDSTFAGNKRDASTSSYCIGGCDNSSALKGTTLNITYFSADITSRPPRATQNGFSNAMITTNMIAQRGICTDSALSNKTAFGAFLVYTISSDLANDGVVPGNGFKGYLDTDVFRAVYAGFPYNTLLDDGKFIYLGSGLAIGWDSSNEVLLRT